MTEDIEEVFLMGDKKHEFDVIKSFDAIKYSLRKIYVYKKVSGSIVTILILYVDDILLIRKVVPILTSI